MSVQDFVRKYHEHIDARRDRKVRKLKQTVETSILKPEVQL
jgi:hypothetical protein